MLEQDSWQLRQNLTLSYDAGGRHDLRVGGEFLRHQFHHWWCSTCNGSLDATRLAAEPKDRVAEAVGARPAKKEPDTTLADPDAFVEYFISAGKKGIAVNRYKGLGEMNPDTLWSTTMDPDVRTLLEVRAEDHAEADQMFTTLMGDQVEPRRKFIEDNALDVRNLDV